MLDGNARQNLATFCQTWEEPGALGLMALAVNKNMIDRDEYPRSAEIERRCVHMMGDLWNAPEVANTVGASASGSLEACMLAGMAAKWRWWARRRAAGKLSGAHLNPAVSIAFALRRDFPWNRVPGYIVVQLAGATLVLHAIINVSATYGSNYPASGYSAMAAFWMALILTAGLVSVILGTASGAQNVGIIGAFGVGAYIALAVLWGSPISGASMNPARTFGPDLASTTFTSYWVYITGPVAGAVLAVGVAFVLRGQGGDKSAAGAAQGELFTQVYESGKS
jgi:glycerol uptake facilitator-like aquaporin